MFTKRRWSKIPESEKYLPDEEGIKRTTRERMAFHGNPDTLYQFVHKYYDGQMICKMTVVHVLQPAPNAYWTTIDSPFFEMTKVG